MSAEPAEQADEHQMIHLGGEDAVIVPMDEYQVLAALRKRATPEAIDEAGMDAVIERHEAWEAAGRPGAKSHEEFMAEMFGGAQ